MSKIVLILVALSLVGCYAVYLPRTDRVVGDAVGIGGEPTSVVMDLWVSRGCPARGDKVTIRYTLTNRGPGKLVVRLDKQPPVMEIIVQVTGPEASVLQRWSDGKPLDELKQLELSPGQSKTIGMEWTVPDTLGASGVSIDMDFQYRDDPPRGRSGGVFLPIAPMCPGY